MPQSIEDQFRELLLSQPALDAPDGVVVDFNNPRTNRGFALGAIVPCLIVTSLVTFLRIYVKTFIARKWYFEDYLLPVAYLFSVAEYVAAIHVYTYAPVVHQWEMTVRTVSKFLLDFHVGAIFYDATMLVLKIIILVQFVRIFVPAGTRSKTYWVTHALIWVNSIFYVVVIFVEIFACKPIRKIWDPLVTGGKCVNTASAYLTTQSFNLALDLLVLIWTQVIIWGLHMPVKQKLGVGILFIPGISACIFAACSVWINVEIFNTTDQAYWGAWMALFTFPETTSGFLVVGLPVVPKFVKHFRAKLAPSTAKSGSAPPSGRGRTFEEGGPRNRDSEGRRTPRSWWHISAASISSKFSSLGSKLTGTTITHNGTQRNSKALQSVDGKQDLGFITFNRDSPDLTLRLNTESNTHVYGGPDAHGVTRYQPGDDDRIESARAGSEIEMDEWVKRPRQEHSAV